MLLKNIGKGSLVLSLFILSTHSYAKPVHDQATCPSISSVQQAESKINDVMEIRSPYYMAYNFAPVIQEHNKSWLLAVGNIMAESEEHALEKAKNSIKNVQYLIPAENNDVILHLSGQSTVCYYGPGPELIEVASLEDE